MVYVPIVFGLKHKKEMQELVHRMKYTRKTVSLRNGID